MTCLSLVPLTGRFYSGKIGLEEEVRVVTDDHNDHTATRAVAVYNTKKVKVCSVSMSSLSPAAPPSSFAFAAPVHACAQQHRGDPVSCGTHACLRCGPA